MPLTIEELRKANYDVYKFRLEDIKDNILLVPYSSYIEAVDELLRQIGSDEHYNSYEWWSDADISASYHFSDDHEYDAELDEIISDAHSELDDIFTDKGDILGVIDEKGIFIPLELYFSYKDNEYMYLEDAVDEIYDDLPDEVTGSGSRTEAYFDTSYGNYLPRTEEWSDTSSCDWDIDIRSSFKDLQEEVNDQTDKILSIPENLRLPAMEKVTKEAEEYIKSMTEDYQKYVLKKGQIERGTIVTMGGQPIEQLIRSVFVDVPLEETDDYSVYAKNIEKAVIKKENIDGTLDNPEDWNDPEMTEELFYKTIKPCTNPEVRIYAMNGIKPRILAGIELGDDDTRRFDEKGERIINELCSRIPEEELVEKSAEAVRKDNELYGTEGIFGEVTEDDVRQGHFNLSGIIANDERIQPYVSILVHNGEPELSLGIVDEELEYTIPLTDNEKKAVMKCIGEKVNLDAFIECLQNYEENEVENDLDIERE